MKHKSDVTFIVEKFHQMICTQFSVPIKVVSLDIGGEYVKAELSKFFLEHIILHENNCPQTP